MRLTSMQILSTVRKGPCLRGVQKRTKTWAKNGPWSNEASKFAAVKVLKAPLRTVPVSPGSGAGQSLKVKPLWHRLYTWMAENSVWNSMNAALSLAIRVDGQFYDFLRHMK